MLISAVSCSVIPQTEQETSEQASSSETETDLKEDDETSSDSSFGDVDSEQSSETKEDNGMITEEFILNFLNKATVLKAGSIYALVNGERTPIFSETETMFIRDGKFYVSEYYLLDTLDIFADSSFKTKKNGESFVSVEAIEEEDFFVFKDTVHETVIISEDQIKFDDSEQETKFARIAVNTFALGYGKVSASIKGDRPVLFVTDDMLEAAKKHALDKKSPQYTSMLDIQRKADDAIISGPSPDKGKSATAYRLAACKDMINAHYMALSYHFTSDEKYLKGAVDFLLAYAGEMLGTDAYLDYSAATTDGEADIGLNIAAPLTTACEVYSLIYNHVSESDRATIETWIAEEAKLVVKGHEFWITNKYYGEQLGNNHLSSHLMGIIAAALVLEDQELMSYALLTEKNETCLQVMIERAILMSGDPVYKVDTDSNFRVGEIYDRYRVVSTPSNGFGYSMYHLKFLTHASLMLYNNGVDYFSYFAENGENMKLSFLVYTDYLIANDSTLHGGHYSGNSLNRENAYSMYLIADHIYHDDRIGELLDAFSQAHVQCNEVELFGVSTLYLLGK